MKISSLKKRWERLEQGKVGYILAWLLGVPIPILIIIYLLKGGD